MKFPYKNMDDFLANATNAEYIQHNRILYVIHTFMSNKEENDEIFKFALSFLVEYAKDKPENWEKLLEEKLFG